MKKIILIVLLLLPLALAVIAAVYLFGVRQYGTPGEYQEQQRMLMQARQDSLDALRAIESPENIADSTLFGMSVQSRIIAETDQKQAEIRQIQTSLDSLEELQTFIEAREQQVNDRTRELEENIAMLQDENARKLAGLYDNMKTNLAVPIFITMDDTLAVRIIAHMQDRNAARLLGAIAEEDVNKAAQLNKLLSLDEVAPGQ